MWLLQNEPEFRLLERLTEVKGRQSQNWERSGSDRLGRKGLDEIKALQADSDDCELAVRFDRHSAKMEVGYMQMQQELAVTRQQLYASFMHHVLMISCFMHEITTTRSQILLFFSSWPIEN